MTESELVWSLNSDMANFIFSLSRFSFSNSIRKKKKNPQDSPQRYPAMATKSFSVYSHLCKNIHNTT